MSRANSPDPALREAVVRQDLDNVLHPIVQHKVLESKQIVVTGGQGSTIFDADGTSYLDGMAGLRRDVDTPEDLQVVLALGAGPRTTALAGELLADV